MWRDQDESHSRAALFTFLFGGSSYVGHGLTVAIPKLEGAAVVPLLGGLAAYVTRRQGEPRVAATPPAPQP